MKVTPTEFEGMVILSPPLFEDARGHFFEAYNKQILHRVGIEINFVQDNQSFSKKNVLRGLHFQRPPYAQTKLVRVLSGSILDVVVDMRKSKPTFGKSFSIVLSSQNHKQLLIPNGFAHGFLVLSEQADVLYKCDVEYHRESEGGILCSDPTLRIDWTMNLDHVVLSDRDRQLLPFLQQESPFH